MCGGTVGPISLYAWTQVKKSGSETPMELRNSAEWFPYFEDCIGMIDGTHIQATLPTSIVARFRGRKPITKNVLAVCTTNKMFTYILAGWEGYANDMTILKDVLSGPSPHGLKVISGKYYLADAGYTTMPRFFEAAYTTIWFQIWL